MVHTLFTNTSETQDRSARMRFGAVSLALHALVLGLIALALRHRTGWIAPYKLPGSPHGTNFVVAYLPDRAPEQSAAAKKAELKPKDDPLTPVLAKRVAKAAAPAAANTLASPNPNATTGADALGSGNITIALTSYFPPPHPDLSPLPPGTRGDVILMATIGTDGKISDLKLVSGLGHGVDEAVIATVEQWVFHPALQDGHPVASQQELHFHYARG